jgi:hypothetical protein
MTTTQDLASTLSARRADLTPSSANGGVEVIPPADPATGEILPVPTPATPVPAGPIAQPDAEPPWGMASPKVLGGLPYAKAYMKLALTIHETEMVPQGFRNHPDKVMAAMMRGHEMGLGPMQSLDSFNVIQGKVGLSAEAMRALILGAGHDIILEERDDGQAVIASCHRKQWPADRWASYVYSLDDAKRAGLLEKDSWKKNTRAMLDARATSGAGRRYFADVLAGMSYTPEEIRDFSGPDQEVSTSPAPTTPPAVESAVAGQSADPTPAEPEATAQPSAEPPAAKPKRARGATKKAAAEAEPAPSPAAEAPVDSAPDASPPASASTGSELVPTEAGAGSPTTPADDPATGSDSDQPTLDGTFPPAAPEPPEAGDGAMATELRRSLKAVIRGLPTVQQPLCRSFLARHFPERTSEDLNAEELTLAINIAGGWPASAEQYPAPGEPEDTF